MFGIGFWELILIFVIALIIFGPEKLPKIATSLGKAYYEFRKTFEEVKFDIEHEVRDLDHETATTTGEEEEKEQTEVKELIQPDGESERSDGSEEGKSSGNS